MREIKLDKARGERDHGRGEEIFATNIATNNMENEICCNAEYA